MSEVLQLDYQRITNKLKPLVDVQISKESMISDDYDINTKNFLSFIVETIETAKANETTETGNVVYKVNTLIKDANKLLTDYFENNSLSAYYSNVLSSTLDSISESLKKAGETFDATNVKIAIIDALKTINSASEAERQKQFETSLKEFKEEFSESFSTEVGSKTEVVQKEVSDNVKKEIASNKSTIEKDINKTTNALLTKTVPEYVKTLDKLFNANFKKYIENNFTNRVKQLTIANRLRNVFNGILMPFAFANKCMLSTKDNLISLGKKVKRNFSERVLKPLSAWKDRLKTRFSEKMHDIHVRFRRATRILRRPKTVMKLWLGKVNNKLSKSSSIETLRKYGPLGLMLKGMMNLIRRTKKNFRLLSQMDFKPFRFLSVATNSVDQFAESISSHATILLSNLKIHLDTNVVEEYNARKKLGFFGRLKEKFKKKDKEEKGFNLLDFLMSLPGLFKMFKKIWNLIKKIYKFIKNSIKFIWKVSKALVKGIARFVGKTLSKIGTKLGWKAAANVGNKMAAWGAKGVGKNASKAAGKAAGKGGIKGMLTGIKNIPRNIKNLKSVQKARGIIKALKPSNIAAAIKGSKLLAKGGLKAAAKSAGKAAGKAIGKGLAKAIPNPISTITAFAMDAAFAAAEAQDTDAMAKLYGIKASEVGAQQRTSYIIAGTLVGGSSLLDADWSSPASIGMAALDTGMTMMKWAGAGAMIGSVIPGVGTVIGAAVGAAVGLVFSLIGTQRLAKAINWVCDAAKAVWKFVTDIPLLGPVIGFAGTVLWTTTKWLFKGIGWLCKGIWWAVKGIGKAIGWLGKMTWGAIKGIGKGIAWLGKMTWKGLKNLWSGAKNLAKKLGGAILNVGKKIGKFFSNVADKFAKGAKALADKIKGGLMSIGKKLKDSIFSIGKSLLSTIFPFSPFALVGKAIKNVFKGIKNFFFGEDESEKQVRELSEKLSNLNTAASSSYSNSLRRSLEKHVMLDSTPDEGNDVDSGVKEDIFDMSRLTDMVDELLKVPPKVVPIPQKSEEKEETQATVAANYWDSQPA